MLRRLLAARRDRLARIKQGATDLLTFLGDMAYSEDRTRAREARVRNDRAGDRYWSGVAVVTADRLGKIVGESTADRYEAGRANDSAPLSREVIEALVDIAEGIADLTHGRDNTTTLHNIGARVRHMIGMAGSTPDLVMAGDDVIAACEELARAGADCAAALKAGTYPELAEAAGGALQRLRAEASRPSRAA